MRLKVYKHKWSILALSILCYLALWMVASYREYRFSKQHIVEEIQAAFQQDINYIDSVTAADNNMLNDMDIFQTYKGKIRILKFKNNQIAAWNNNQFAPNDILKLDLRTTSPLLTINNDVIYFRRYETVDTTVNPSDTFKYYFVIPLLNLDNKDSKIHISEVLDKNIIAHQLNIKSDNDGTFEITDNGKPAFYIDFTGDNYIKSDGLLTFFYIAFIFCLFTSIYLFSRLLETKQSGWALFFSLVCFTIINKLFVKLVMYPDQLADTMLFSRELLSSYEYYSNLNEMICLLVGTYLFNIQLIRVLKNPVSHFLLYRRRYFNYILGYALAIGFVSDIFTQNIHIISTLVFDSKLSLVTDSLQYLNFSTVIGISLIMLLCINTSLMVYCVYKIAVRMKIKSSICYINLLFLSLVMVYVYYEGSNPVLVISTFIFTHLIYYLIQRIGQPLVFSIQSRPRNVSWQLWIVLFGLYSTFIITFFHNKKEEAFRLIYAESNLKKPNNKFEFNFSDQLDFIKSDPNIRRWVGQGREVDRVANYIISNYFPRQENELIVQATVTTREAVTGHLDELQYQDDITEPTVYKAYLDFGSIILKLDVQFKDIFYYKKNKMEGTLVGKDLYFDHQFYSRYFTAKYANNVLVDFDVIDFYPEKIPEAVAEKLQQTSRDFVIYNHLNYSDLYYKNPFNNEIILVKYKRNLAVQIITTLSTIIILLLVFIVYYLIVSNSVQQVRNKDGYSRGFYLNINTKINFAVWATLFISFVVLGVTIIYVLNNNEKSQNFNRNGNNISIVKLYLESNANGKTENEIWSELVHNFNIIALLYDTTGVLVQDARYDQKYYSMDNKYLLKPDIPGRLKASFPFFIAEQSSNNFNSYADIYTRIAIRDQPYILNIYDANNKWANGENISDIILVIMNVFILVIFLASFITFFVTNNSFKPLNIITQKFKKIALQHNELIEWPYEDEFSILVNEYNKMILKVENLAQKLSIQERENIWREMAQQVAHEIKNPLTPMRLNIQFLQRAIAEKRDNIGEMTAKVCHIIIEQIETLNHIATEFSAFAKIDQMNPEVIRVHEHLSNIIHLFRVEKDIAIRYLPPPDDTKVNMDKSYFIRSVNNILKNAIQAIPDDREKVIQISCRVEKKKIVIAIKDNGEGIPEEIRPKLFTPYFTTKSKGTGIGLSMTKNMIEMSGGLLTYETVLHTGTTFFITLPLYTSADGSTLPAGI